MEYFSHTLGQNIILDMYNCENCKTTVSDKRLSEKESKLWALNLMKLICK